jgi:hypothetical protein
MKIKSTIYLIMTLALFFSACSPELPPASSISNFRTYPLINTTYTTVADLAKNNSENTDHQITITKPSLIMVSAQVRIDNPGGIPVRGASQLFISDGTGSDIGLAEMGRPAVYYSDANPASQITVPLIGSAIKQPGTYNVIVKCQQLGALGKTTGMLDNMVVWIGAHKSVIKN